MLHLEKLIVGQLATNCYLVFDSETRESVILDPGDDGEFLIQKIKDLDLTPKFVLATHCHFDHIQAVNEIKLAFKIPFLINKKEETLLKHYRKSAIHFIKLDPGPAPKANGYLKGKQKLVFGKHSLVTIPTPGHTPGSICLYSKKDKILFSGDTIFSGGEVGRTDLAYSSKENLKESIKKLLKLPKETTIYPGHGEKTTLAKFKKDYETKQVLGLRVT